VPRGDQVAMFTVEPLPPTEQLEIVLAKPVHQMIATRVAGPMRPREAERLDASAAPEMLELVERRDRARSRRVPMSWETIWGFAWRAGSSP
jgi:hypothetical protein